MGQTGRGRFRSSSWTLQAALAAGYGGGLDQSFLEGLLEGSIWPDAPDGKGTFSLFFLDVEAGFDPTQAAINNGAWMTYRSHFGDLQYLHGMSVPGKTC